MTGWLKLIGVVAIIGFFGFVDYKGATDRSLDQWEPARVDQLLAEIHCNSDDQCEDDLNVALRGCLDVHKGDEAMYCQYRYMAKLGIRLPIKDQDGKWVSAQEDELQAWFQQTQKCSNSNPLPSCKGGDTQCENDFWAAASKKLACDPKWHP